MDSLFTCLQKYDDNAYTKMLDRSYERQNFFEKFLLTCHKRKLPNHISEQTI